MSVVDDPFTQANDVSGENFGEEGPSFSNPKCLLDLYYYFKICITFKNYNQQLYLPVLFGSIFTYYLDFNLRKNVGGGSTPKQLHPFGCGLAYGRCLLLTVAISYAYFFYWRIRIRMNITYQLVPPAGDLIIVM